jgi:WD40 repeat protein
VLRARDKELERDVAVKELLEPTERAEARFFREALITARLEHPGIVPIHEAGRWPDGTPFYAMKLVAGRPLSELIAGAETLDERLALLPNVITVADAIAYAHDRGIIHRDLKPSNVIVGEFGETIVVDWGLAKEVAADDEAGILAALPRSWTLPDVTEVGGIVGTPAYMSPEQARAGHVDTRSDIYSLGVMLFELCAAEVPGRLLDESELRGKLRETDDDLAAIVLKCLSAEPAERYADAGALAADLRSYAGGARISARRYSVAAVLGHWIRHHKQVSLSAAVIALVALTVGAMTIREIVSQRDRAATAQVEAEVARLAADGARHAAEQERDRAVRSEAAAHIERDPAAARKLLESSRSFAAADSLLLAQALGASPVERFVMLGPRMVTRVVPDAALGTLAIATADNTLRLVDVATGRIETASDSLLGPPLVFRDGQGFIYVRQAKSGPELVRSSDPDSPIALPRFREAPIEGVSAVDGVYLLDGSGDLFLLAGGGLRRVRQGVRTIVAYRDGVLACDDVKLPALGSVRATAPGGRCHYHGGSRTTGPSDDGYVIHASSRAGKPEAGSKHSSGREANGYAVTASGLVVGIDKAGTAWYVEPGSGRTIDGPPPDAMPRSFAADGSLAAWGYTNGTVRVRETRHGATWTFIGHPAPISWLFISERLGRVVAVGGPQVRVWRIPAFSLRPIGDAGTDAYNIAASPNGRWLALDGADGAVRLFERGRPSPELRILHRHENFAFGVTWRGDEVCSSSWDGKVMCTDVVSARTSVIADHARPVRFVHAAGSVLAYVVQDGGVWMHDAGASAPRFLHRHAAEPYRVAVSPKGDVASGAHDGSLMIFDRATGTVRVAPALHTDRVSTIVWSGDDLHTSSWDGTLRVWGKDAALKRTASTADPIRQFRLVGTGWAASVGALWIWIRAGDADLRLDVAPLRITDLSSSTDDRYVSALAGGYLVVYDLRARAVAAVRVGDKASSCAQFLDATTMIACGSSGEISSIEVDKLPFVEVKLDEKK